MSLQNDRIKTKNQTVFSFFESLQKEYILAQLRSKIYPNYRDKKYYKDRVMEGKKSKIEEIARRNGLESIFDSKPLYHDFYSRVIPDWGLPYFTYLNEEDKNKRSNQDIMNYFSKGSEVVIKEKSGKVKLGKIISNDYLLANNTIDIRKKGEKETLTLPIMELKRML